MGEKTQYDYLKGELDLFNKSKDKLTKKIKDFCQNPKYLLADRWKLFIESNLGYDYSYILHLDSIDLSKVLDHSSYNVTNFISSIEDTYNQESIDLVKEEILQSFIKSFIYD